MQASLAHTLPGVGVSSQRFFRAGVAPSARPGVASHLLAPPGVASHRPGVASAAAPGVASQRLTEGVASTESQSDTFAFFLRAERSLSRMHRFIFSQNVKRHLTLPSALRHYLCQDAVTC